MPLIVTHPEPRTLDLVRQIAEAGGCTVTDAAPRLTPAEGIAALDALRLAPEDLAQEAWADDDTALALARRLAPGLAWTAPDDYVAEARIAEGTARLARDSHGRGYLTVLPSASGWRWLDDYPVHSDRLDSARAHIAGGCRCYLADHQRTPHTAAIASRVRGVQALLAGLEAGPVPAEILR